MKFSHALIALLVTSALIAAHADDDPGAGPSASSAPYSNPSLMSAEEFRTYAAKVQAFIRPHIMFEHGHELPVPVVEVEVRTLPDGAVKTAKVVKPSGVASWDNAVMLAIEKVGRIPLDTHGRVPAQLLMSFRPR